MQSRAKWLLAAMMFFEYAVWGSWTPIFAETVGHRLNATGAAIGAIYGVLWLACIITPFIGGQLVDRYMPSQVFMGIAAIVCTFSAWMMANQSTVDGIVIWMWVWSLAFAPTLGITNSIVFHHVSNNGESEAQQEKDFSVIRTAGTIGWALTGWALTAYLLSRPEVPKGTWRPFEEMQFAAVLGALLAIVSFILPNTPPSKEVKDPWAFTKSFTLFKTVPGFGVFMLISFIVSTEFQFFYTLSAPFLTDAGQKAATIPAVKSISQLAEIISLAVFLPIALRKFGMRKTLVFGTFAWPLRYFVFAAYKIVGLPLVILSLMFHGIGYAFVFVTSYIYIDRVAPKDIRGSAQSLMTLVTLGVGNYLGTYFSGHLKDHYTTFIPDPNHVGQMIPGPVNWPMVFMVPAILTTVCGIAFGFTFIEPPSQPVALKTEEANTLSRSEP
jgi:nucleoside transporter